MKCIRKALLIEETQFTKIRLAHNSESTSITPSITQQYKDKEHGCHTKKREIIEEVWLINAVRTKTEAEGAEEHALPENDTISGFVSKTIDVVGEITAREENVKTFLVF